MTKNEFIEVFRRQYGYEPEGKELEELMKQYQVDDEEEEEQEENDYWSNRHQQQKSKVYSFSNNSYRSHNDNSVSDLIREVKDLFNVISGLAGKSTKHTGHDSNYDEFSHMLIAFIFKSALYFLLKSAYSKGYSAVDI